MPNLTVKTLLLARHLLPISPANAVLNDHGVAVENGRILEIDSNQSLLKKHPEAAQVDLRHHIVMPGLINAHGHLAMSLMRGLGEGRLLDTWLREVIRPLETRFVSRDFVAAGTRLAIAEMLSRGVTTASDMYYFPEVTAAVAAELGFRAQIAFPVIEQRNSYSNTADECIHRGVELNDTYRTAATIHLAFGPHAAYTVTKDVLTRVFTLAAEIGIPIQMHIHETRQEVRKAHEKVGCSWIEYLDRYGMLVPELQAVHMTSLTVEEIQRVAERGVKVIHCPYSNLKLNSGACPIADLYEAGITVALGTDSAASNNALDLLGDARLAALLANYGTENPFPVTSEQILESATLGGARALGLEAEIGSIESGKAADLIAIDVDSPDLQPMFDAHAQLIHTAATNHVSHTWVAGKLLYENGNHVCLDVNEVVATAHTWRDKLSS
ncbi:MAG: amidohydrolase family protein [Pseudomonadota bacterium]|nr:amidohydrolase family protein [Pseudomonadota bacterium]